MSIVHVDHEGQNVIADLSDETQTAIPICMSAMAMKPGL